MNEPFHKRQRTVLLFSSWEVAAAVSAKKTNGHRRDHYLIIDHPIIDRTFNPC